MSLLMK